MVIKIRITPFYQRSPEEDFRNQVQILHHEVKKKRNWIKVLAGIGICSLMIKWYGLYDELIKKPKNNAIISSSAINNSIEDVLVRFKASKVLYVNDKECLLYDSYDKIYGSVKKDIPFGLYKINNNSFYDSLINQRVSFDSFDDRIRFSIDDNTILLSASNIDVLTDYYLMIRNNNLRKNNNENKK